jgi:hypothetical protein
MGALGEIGGEEPGHPQKPRRLEHEETDRATAEHTDAGSRAEMGQVHGVKRHPQGLEHRPVGIAEGGGERDETARRPGQPLTEAAVVLPVPREAGLFAEIGVTLEAEGAGLARDGGVQRYAPPVIGDARELVAEDEGPGEAGVADLPLREPVEVGAAEPDRRDPHERLSLARLRAVLLVQAQVALPVEAQAAH